MIAATIAVALASTRDLPDIYVHYMPWYQAKPVSKEWGWHWTMSHFNPEKTINGRPEIASRYTPQIGPYDSSDPDVLEYQVLCMKIAGVQGAMIDWYGKEDVYDYADNHRHTTLFIAELKKAGLKYSIVMEDATLPNLIKFGKVEESKATEYGTSLITWMDQNFFSDPAYVKLDGKPLLLVFGPQYYKGNQWDEMTKGKALKLFGVNGPYDFKNGGFAWPAPKDGLGYTEKFYKRGDGEFIAGAFPRFNDIYAVAKVHDSWGSIPDDNGETFKKTLAWGIASGSPILQIATWNDWGEGTQIEPSVEFGNRDLIELQKLARERDKQFPYGSSDFDLPLKLFRLRKEKRDSAILDQARKDILAGHVAEAREKLATKSRTPLTKTPIANSNKSQAGMP